MCHQRIWYIILTKNSMMIIFLAGEISNWLNSALSFYLLVGWNPWMVCYDCEYSSHMPATAAHLRYFTRFCCLEIRVTCMLPECHSQLSTQFIHSFSFNIIVVTIIVVIHDTCHSCIKEVPPSLLTVTDIWCWYFDLALTVGSRLTLFL